MRFVLIAVAALAGVKVWSQDRLYRSAVSERVVAAYKSRAAETCLGVSAKRSDARSPNRHNPWTSAAISDVAIGDSGANVAIWDFDNPMWNVRFRHPHLILTTTGEPHRSCAYDLVVGIAAVR